MVGARWHARASRQVTLVDDPTLKEFQGQPLLGSYDVDDEGVKAERVSLVRKRHSEEFADVAAAGPDFAIPMATRAPRMLSDTQPLSSNLILQSSDALKSGDLRKEIPRCLPRRMVTSGASK